MGVAYLDMAGLELSMLQTALASLREEKVESIVSERVRPLIINWVALLGMHTKSNRVNWILESLCTNFCFQVQFEAVKKSGKSTCNVQRPIICNLPV